MKILRTHVSDSLHAEQTGWASKHPDEFDSTIIDYNMDYNRCSNM